MFDLYLKEEQCKNDEYRATLLAARMDAECLNIIKNLDDKVIKSYTRMKSFMLRTFNCNTKSTCEYQIMFLHRKMTENETVHQYYAELVRLARLGYPSLSEDQLFQQVGELFMRSLTKNHSQPSKSLVSQSQLNKTSQSEVNNVHDQIMAYDLENNQHENSMLFNTTEFINDELSQLMQSSQMGEWSFNEDDWLDISSDNETDEVEKSFKVSNYHKQTKSALNIRPKRQAKKPFQLVYDKLGGRDK
jgi:hypothetical protein